MPSKTYQKDHVKLRKISKVQINNKFNMNASLLETVSNKFIIMLYIYVYTLL